MSSVPVKKRGRPRKEPSEMSAMPPPSKSSTTPKTSSKRSPKIPIGESASPKNIEASRNPKANSALDKTAPSSTSLKQPWQSKILGALKEAGASKPFTADAGHGTTDRKTSGTPDAGWNNSAKTRLSRPEQTPNPAAIAENPLNPVPENDQKSREGSEFTISGGGVEVTSRSSAVNGSIANGPVRPTSSLAPRTFSPTAALQKEKSTSKPPPSVKPGSKPSRTNTKPAVASPPKTQSSPSAKISSAPPKPSTSPSSTLKKPSAPVHSESENSKSSKLPSEKAAAEPISAARPAQAEPKQGFPVSYKSASRRITAAMVATTIAIGLSFELYQRFVLGKDPKIFPKLYEARDTASGGIFTSKNSSIAASGGPSASRPEKEENYGPIR